MPDIKRIPAGQGFDRITEAVTTEFSALLYLVRQALQDKVRAAALPSSDYSYVDVQGIWPDRVVYGLRGRLYSCPYTVGADNTITIGDATEVVAAFTAVREAAPGDANALLREAADGSGAIEVTLICAGKSINNNYYPDTVLREAAPMFEGVRVFVKSDAEHSGTGGKDVRNLLGGLYGVRFVEGAQPDTGRLVGTFKPIDPTDAVVTKMTEAVKRGMQGLMGLSIDAVARTKTRQVAGTKVRAATAFVRVNSVDLIVAPGAGGGLDRLTEAADESNPSPEQPGEDMLKTRLIEALAVISATAAASVNAQSTDDQVVAALREACTAAKLDFGQVVTAAGGEGKPAVERLVEAARLVAQAAPGTQRVTEADATTTPVTRAELAQHQASMHAVTAITSSTLPQVAKDKLLAQFKGTARFTEAEVDQAIKGEREYLARFTESGRPTGGFPRVEVGDRKVVVADMLDAFFDPAHKNHRDVGSFRECYIEITGDRQVTGRADHVRLTESIGTDTFANALGTSLTRRLQQIYKDYVAYDAWRAVTVQAPVNDFRLQERTQIGGYGDLPAVAERAAYTPFTDPSDAKATYSVSKRGGLAQVTMEAIKNDDVGTIRRVPVELGRAAKRTLFKFAMNFFASNPVIYDTVALYHASHGNLAAAALDAAQIAAHRLLMKKQTGRDTATRMGIGPRYLLVPDDLQETAFNLFNRNTNLDKTFVQEMSLSIVPVPTWTDTNDWVTVADPMDIPVLEIGFLDGQEEPVLLTQDSPTEGSVFTNDMITYKIRHIYGGNVLVDGFKGTTKAVVP